MTERVLFGDRLRRARERQKLSVRQIADETKLSASIISALEDGSCARWPVGVYSRSYVRSYAELVGLDPAETAAEFVTLFPELAFLALDRAAERDRDARLPAHLRPRTPVAPLRLFLEEVPAAWWSRLLTRVAWWLHRVANGAMPVLDGASATGPWASGSHEEASPFATLQVDHD